MVKSFILYQEYKENLSCLSQEQKGQLLDAIFAYNEGVEIELDAVVKMAFSFIKSDLDRNKEKYEKMLKRNQSNGSKGGRPKEPKKPSGLLENPVKPTQTLNDNDNDNDNVNVNVNDNGNENDKEYSFEGKVIRLTKKDFDQFKTDRAPNLSEKQYRNCLSDMDAYYASKDITDTWHRIGKWLDKENKNHPAKQSPKETVLDEYNFTN